MGNGKRWVVGVVLAFCAAGAGCVTFGKPEEQAKGDVPLVPLPPFPNGRQAYEVKAPADPPPPAAKPAAPPEVGPRAKDDRPANNSARVTARRLIEVAQARVDSLDSYIVRLTRRETVGDKADPAPEQLILFKFRQRPWSVHLKWLGKEGNGREVVYVKGHHQGKIHSRLAAGDMPFMPAGKRLALSPDNALVKSATRHPITEAGIAASVARLAAVQAALEKGETTHGTLTVRARVDRPEFTKPVAAIDHVLPPDADPTLPKGGTRSYFLHPENGLPMLIQTTDEGGKEVEYYRYDRLQAEVKLDDADFDPKLLYGEK